MLHVTSRTIIRLPSDGIIRVNHPAVSIILVQRLWQACSGLVTMILIAYFLSPVEQGWYYSFLSLAALYTLFDLGLSVVLIQISAHLFIRLRWLAGGAAEGENLGHFQALLGRSSRLYLLLALAFSFLILPAGLLFFSARDGVALLPGGQWEAPWVMLIVVTAMGILALPFLALVEGSGRVGEVYGVRLAQGVLGSFACWIVLATGGGLWATVMLPAMGLLVALGWLLTIRPALFHAAWHHAGKELEWRRDVWPLQWRIGLSWLSGYLLTQIYTPILFHTQGAVVAGQMGLSLTIANMLGLLAQSWIARSVPAMAQAVGRGDWHALDRMFARDFVVSIVAFVGVALLLCGLHVLLQASAYGTRLLPFWPFVGLLGVALIGHIIGALAAQLRSFRREPLVWLSVAGALLTVPAAVWAASVYSAEGVVSVMFGVQFLFMLPVSVVIWKRRNHEWRPAA